jgi:hypothetical protein
MTWEEQEIADMQHRKTHLGARLLYYITFGVVMLFAGGFILIALLIEALMEMKMKGDDYMRQREKRIKAKQMACPLSA